MNVDDERLEVGVAGDELAPKGAGEEGAGAPGAIEGARVGDEEVVEGAAGFGGTDLSVACPNWTILELANRLRA